MRKIDAFKGGFGAILRMKEVSDVLQNFDFQRAVRLVATGQSPGTTKA
jgi:hypothetical protein